MASLSAKANIAATQAINAGASPRDLEIARQYMGSKNFIGYCQRFVRQVTGGKTTGASAIEAWNKAPQKIQGAQGLQKGDLVYFSPNSSNRNYGHTGIYEGNGQFISATDSGVKSSGLLDWIKSTGQKLLGYVPNSQRAMGLGGQQGSQSNSTTFTPPTPQQAINHALQMRKIGMKSQIPIPMPPTPDSSSPFSNIDLNPNRESNVTEYT